MECWWVEVINEYDQNEDGWRLLMNMIRMWWLEVVNEYDEDVVVGGC